MKKFILLLLLGLMLIMSCKNYNQKSEKKEKTTLFKYEQEFREMFFRENAVLLSYKYSIDEEIVFKFLVEHAENSINNIIYNEKYMRNSIEYYSNKYGIKKGVIASILIDQKMMGGKE